VKLSTQGMFAFPPLSHYISEPVQDSVAVNMEC